MFATNRVLIGHSLELADQLPDNFISMIATSPPYWKQRDYNTRPVYWPEISYSPMAGLPQITIPAQKVSLGQEEDPFAYTGHLVAVFRALYSKLRDDGVLWLNLGDKYINKPGNGRGGKEQVDGGIPHYSSSDSVGCGLPEKNLTGIPWRVAFALQADNWILRLDNIWQKTNGLTESVTDRPTKMHEYIFLFSKSKRYYFDNEAIKEPMAESSKKRLAQDVENQNGSDRANGGNKTNGPMKAAGDPEVDRNKRSVWSVGVARYSEAHFATWPEELVEPMILAGTSDYGCCTDCGSPYERVLDYKANYEKREVARQPDNSITKVDSTGWKPATIKHRGWQKTCDCLTDKIRPAIVLDPFFGSGTTGKVAIKNRRDYLGFELNPEYAIDLAGQRTDGVQIKLIS